MTLRAKIDMQSPNMNLRDPPMYRIRFTSHHRAGDKWKIYPIYDFAHGNEDAIEGVTHSICTLGFENHRELYDWFLDNTSIIPSRPVQKEFARLEVEGAVTSKRKLVRPEGIKRFCDAVGVTDRNSVQLWELFEECVRK